MKYIRTKEGVYELANERTITEFQVIDYLHNRAFLKSDIIAQANTIEELCDEFIGIDKTCENGHQLLRAIPYKCANYWNGGVYGAFWCEWGLKYVAKMNQEGEFELI